MKKWYKQPYFNAQAWILTNFEILGLNSEETIFLLLTDYARKNRIPINNEFYKNKMRISQEHLDEIMASLVAHHYLAINVTEKGVRYDIDGIFEFDIETYEVIENKSVYDQTSDFLKRPLSSAELLKISELLEKYGEKNYVQACRLAEAYRKYSLAYIEGILRNGKQQGNN